MQAYCKHVASKNAVDMAAGKTAKAPCLCGAKKANTLRCPLWGGGLKGVSVQPCAAVAAEAGALSNRGAAKGTYGKLPAGGRKGAHLVQQLC